MPCYSAYGLSICSDLGLSELITSKANGEADVSVRVGTVNRLPPEVKIHEGCFHATPREAYFFWKEDGMYLARDGREIIVDPAPDADEQVLRLVILGMALGAVLHQRGLLTLHGSAVVKGDLAVAFLGAKGTGKSATAAALHARGYDMIADEIVALDRAGAASLMVLPGFPQFKLWPDVAESLDVDPETLPRLHPQMEKRAHHIVHGFSQVPLPLRRIYVLDDGADLEIESLGPRQSFFELVQHSYALRFLGTAGVSAAHFRQCAHVARTVPVSRLKRPRSVSALSDVALLVERDLRSND
jgi:hypothetical protein